MFRAVAIAVLLLGLTPAAARGAQWRWPVRGDVVAGYDYDRADPYRAGQRRGLSVAAPPGTPVRSACAGTVAFAGVVAGEPTISVRCGELRATYQGITAIGVDAGERIPAGRPIAAIARSGALHLGARRTPTTYVDPAGLLGADRPPIGPAPRSRPRPPSRPIAAPGRHAPPPAARPVPAPAPPAAYLALALLALALPIGAVRHRRETLRRRAAGGALAAATRAGR